MHITRYYYWYILSPISYSGTLLDCKYGCLLSPPLRAEARHATHANEPSRNESRSSCSLQHARVGAARKQELQYHARAALTDCIGIRFSRCCPVAWTAHIMMSLLLHIIWRPLVWSKRHIYRSRVGFKGWNEALLKCFGIWRKEPSAHADQPQALHVGTIGHV
jgi:hypothetical protein